MYHAKAFIRFASIVVRLLCLPKKQQALQQQQHAANSLSGAVWHVARSAMNQSERSARGRHNVSAAFAPPRALFRPGRRCLMTSAKLSGVSKAADLEACCFANTETAARWKIDRLDNLPSCCFLSPNRCRVTRWSKPLRAAVSCPGDSACQGAQTPKRPRIASSALLFFPSPMDEHAVHLYRTKKEQSLQQVSTGLWQDFCNTFVSFSHRRRSYHT